MEASNRCERRDTHAADVVVDNVSSVAATHPSQPPAVMPNYEVDRTKRGNGRVSGKDCRITEQAEVN